MRPHVLITRRVQEQAVSLLREHCEVTVWEHDEAMPRDKLLDWVKGKDAIFCTISDQIDAQVLESSGPQLAVVATMSVGTYHIDAQACRSRNIEVAPVPDVGTDSAAELTCTLLLIAARRTMEGRDAVLRGEWGLWKPMWICGVEFGQRTLGILGFGRVGFGVARRMTPFGISRILYNDVQHASMADHVNAHFVDRDRLYRESDFIVICAALTGATQKMINRDALGKMKKECILVNTSNGKIVDHDALADALRNGRISGAALDVTDPEPLPVSHALHSLPNCLITPHLGTNSSVTRQAMAVNTAKNIIAVLLNRAKVSGASL